MNFQNYYSKPIIRNAAEIPVDSVIEYYPEKSEACVDEQYFKCYEEPKHGDFVVYLNDEDIYHCSRKVFFERNEREPIK
ncbi:hypothetical protein [uncultured Paraglaciecola sp.]|uniref:hypothetical protein n=1 Tax=uncultured Paraglaciecola sp. TaxID=1765024 RepID=UPI002629E972|nr:hypothetical protein [uncultured Paraglaciecola sp.]